MNSDFYSIDRLMEFGLSLAISQQMINSMNQSMKQMHIPGSIMTMPAPNVIFVAIDEKPVGPLSECEFIRLLSSGKVTKETLAWIPGMANWQKIEDTPEILKIVALTPPPLMK